MEVILPKNTLNCPKSDSESEFEEIDDVEAMAMESQNEIGGNQNQCKIELED